MQEREGKLQRDREQSPASVKQPVRVHRMGWADHCSRWVCGRTSNVEAGTVAYGAVAHCYCAYLNQTGRHNEWLL